MRILTIAALALPLAATEIASADTATGTMNGVQHVGAKARCSPGDPNVLVNKNSKTFVLDTSAKTTMKAGHMKTGMSNDEALGAGSTKSMQSSMVSMCKSEAISMGAKMSGGGKSKSM